MTGKDSQVFFGCLGKLAVMYRMKLDKAAARVYFEALDDIPIELLVAAMQKLLGHGGDFMPTAGRIREEVDKVQERLDADDRQRAITAGNRLMLEGDVAAGPREPICKKCDDTGKRRTCPGCMDPNTCEKVGRDLYCPEYKEGKYSLPVMTCECAATNPEIMRKRKLETKRPRYGAPKRERNFYGRDDD